MKIQTREIRIKPTRPQYDILVSQKQINIFLAGQGSGKTFCAGIISGIMITKYPNIHGFIGANTYMQLSDSTLYRIRTVWREDFGWTEYSKFNPKGNYVVDIQPPTHFNTQGHEYDTYYGKICFQNGTVIYKGSLDNYKAHEGKEFGWAILDETKDTKEEAVKEVIIGRLRERGMTNESGEPWNPLFIFTSPAKVQWINEWFSLEKFSTEITTSIYSSDTYFRQEIENKFVVISSTYHNEQNLPENYIENQKLNMHRGLQDMLIYGNPFSQSGGEFYKCFNRIKQVKPNPITNGHHHFYKAGLPLHITFDFNVHPYMTCNVWQMDGKKATQIDEICLSNPNNTTPTVCKEFIRRYQGHEAGLFIYGDPSGDHEDTRVEKRTEEKYNDFVLIRNALAQFKPALRIDSAAPPVVMRGNFINTIFEKNFEGIEIIIGDNCKNTINDYQYLKEDADGRKFKEKVKDPQTLVSYEKLGHTSDANDYFICWVFRSEFTKYQRGTSRVEFSQGKTLQKNAW